MLIKSKPKETKPNDGIIRYKHSDDPKPIGKISGIVVVLKDGSTWMFEATQEIPLGWLDRIEEIQFEIKKENTHETGTNGTQSDNPGHCILGIGYGNR
jgi:hypothetical protein